jgi:hypothetical protein
MIKGLLKHFKFEIDNKIPVVLDKIFSQLHFEMSKILLSMMKSSEIESDLIVDLNRALQLQIQRNNVESSKNLLLCVLLCPKDDNFAIIQTVLKALHSILINHLSLEFKDENECSNLCLTILQCSPLLSGNFL